MYISLVVSVSFTKELVEPGGSTTVLFRVSVSGGESLYNFMAAWSDGIVWSNTLGTFSHTSLAERPFPLLLGLL